MISYRNYVISALLQVPNIRFNVAKGLEMVAPACGKTVYDSQIRPVLSVLTEDSDRDVCFFARKTLQTLDVEFGSSN